MSQSRPLHVIVLAAGQGKRMRSDLPKVLHTIGGQPMAEHVLRAVEALSPEGIHVVHGHGGDEVKRVLGANRSVEWAFQAEQLGTGHAVAQAIDAVPAEAAVVVCYGDVPLVTPETLERVAAPARAGNVALLTAVLADPTGYGRVTRDGDRVSGIVEQKDASPEQQLIDEINTGILGGPADAMARYVHGLRNDTAQGEYYLTDVIGAAAADGHEIVTATVDPAEVEGVNDRVQLGRLERRYQARKANELMLAGAQLADPSRIDVRGTVEVGRDVYIDVSCVFEGHVVIEDGAHIGPFCHIRDARIGAGSQVNSHCSLEGATLAEQTVVGPFARLRPGAVLGQGARVGNFVEVKNATLGAGAKANHLTYLGDARVGAASNIGAGTITCNYDGANKHFTEIGDNVFVGSGVQLVAPVRLGSGVTIGAGSTISSDVDEGLLALTRPPAKVVAGWVRPVKKKN